MGKGSEGMQRKSNTKMKGRREGGRKGEEGKRREGGREEGGRRGRGGVRSEDSNTH